MFVDDLFRVPWENIEKHDNVDDALELWNSLFFDVINNHLPMQNKRVNPKRAGGGGIRSPPRHFLLYLSRLLFCRAETSWLFSFKPCARFKTIFFKIGPGVMTRRCVIEPWVQRKTDQKLIFRGYYTQIVFFVFFFFFVFFCFRIHFHHVLSYLFGLFGVRTCVSILWHTSLPKNATFALKNSEKPWFWRFLVIFVFLTWRHLWRHCGVIQGMFVLFLVPWTWEGHSYPLVPHTWCFVNRFPRS